MKLIYLFFIRQTILKEHNSLSNKHYLFYINNRNCEVNIPKRSNVEVIYNHNCFDFEAYGQGINHLKNKFPNFNNEFSHILLMNCSVTGPFYESGDFLDKFNERLLETNSLACSNILARLENIVRLPGYFLYFNISLLHLMKDVFKKHINKWFCILNGEFKFTDILNKNKIKYTSLSHKDITLVPNRFDRHTNSRLNDIVFIKVNWRSTWFPNRDSLPVREIETHNLINKICNFKKFSDNYPIDYDNIQCPNVGRHDHLFKYSWNTKQIFYNLYGKAEEFITFPLRTNILTVGIALYSHYSDNNILSNYCVEGIKCLIQLGFKVVLLTNCNNFNNITYIPCEKYIVKDATNDYYMIRKYLNEHLIDNYKYLLLVNDSIAFPIRDLNQVRLTFNKQRGKVRLLGSLDFS